MLGWHYYLSAEIYLQKFDLSAKILRKGGQIVVFCKSQGLKPLLQWQMAPPEFMKSIAQKAYSFTPDVDHMHQLPVQSVRNCYSTSLHKHYDMDQPSNHMLTPYRLPSNFVCKEYIYLFVFIEQLYN